MFETQLQSTIFEMNNLIKENKEHYKKFYQSFMENSSPQPFDNLVGSLTALEKQIKIDPNFGIKFAKLYYQFLFYLSLDFEKYSKVAEFARDDIMKDRFEN